MFKIIEIGFKFKNFIRNFDAKKDRIFINRGYKWLYTFYQKSFDEKKTTNWKKNCRFLGQPC